MAYEFVTVAEDQPDGQRFNRTYMLCNGCKSPVGKQPGQQDWAAWDAPDIPVDSGNRDNEGKPVFTYVMQRHVALCSACYVKAFKVRYPEAEPPKLYDGRVKLPKGKTSGKVSS